MLEINRDDPSSQCTWIVSNDEYYKSIYRLVAARKWAQLQITLQERSGCDSRFFRPILHFACRFHPPLSIIQLLDARFPQSITTADNMGKWPIHYAAEFGAPCSVIKYLTVKDRRSAGAQDVAGMTPLHYLCRYYAARHQPIKDSGQSTKECMLDALKTFVRAAPSSLNLEDKDEVNAIEYAIDSEVDISVVKTLQKCCELQHKRERRKLMRQKCIGGDKCVQIDITDQSTKAGDSTKLLACGNAQVALLGVARTRPRRNRAVAA